MTRKALTLDSILSWGKYEGETLKHAIKSEPKYVQILIEDVSWFEIDAKAWKYYQEKLELEVKEHWYEPIKS